MSLTIVPREIESYLLRFVRRRHPLLKEMERLAEKIRFDAGGGRTIAFPIIGPLVGSLVAHYAKLAGARRVFELGSGYGYSAFWFAQAVGPRGRVICTEGRRENAETAMKFLRRAGLASRVRFHVGDGVQELRRQRNGSQDVVFIDMEKTRYPLGLRAAMPKLRAGGLLIADNLLWGGAVTRPAKDASTRGLQRFTKLITASPRLSTVIHPIRDGVSVSLKK